MNFFTNLDCFSPKITLYFNKRAKHSSVFSVFLSLIQYIFCLSITVYYIILFFSHKRLKHFCLKQYFDNPGIFYLASENFRHEIELKENTMYDPRAITIIGIQGKPNKIFPTNLHDFPYDYWIYDRCDNSPENKRLCIKKQYKNEDKKTYDSNENGFTYPLISQSSMTNLSIPYTILILKCLSNDDENNSCYEADKIEEKISEINEMSFSFSNKFIDFDRYREPFVDHLMRIELELYENSTLISNLYFNQARLITSFGMLFEVNDEKREYVFDKVINSYTFKQNTILGILYLNVDNKIKEYKRYYLNVIDICIHIVTSAKILWCFLYLLNYYVNRYVVYDDFGYLYQKNFSTVIRLNTSSYSKTSSIRSTNVLQGFGKRNKNKDDISLFSLNKQSRYSLCKLICYYYGCKVNSLIKNLINLRCRILDEELMIKFFIMIHDIDGSTSFGNKSRSKIGGRSLFQSIVESEKKSVVENNSSADGLVKKQNFITEIISEKKGE